MWMQLPHAGIHRPVYEDYDTSFRILEEPLMIVGIGVAFAKEDERGSVSRWIRPWKRCARMAHL